MSGAYIRGKNENLSSSADIFHKTSNVTIPFDEHAKLLFLSTKCANL